MNRLTDNADAYRNRTISLRRGILIAALLVVLLPVLTITFVIARVNPNQYAPQIVAAVDQATGRQLTLGGPINVDVSLAPVVELNGLTLSNPTGFGSADMLSIPRIEAKIALIPLFSHHVDILNLLVVGPKVTLATKPDGEANWDFGQNYRLSMAVPGASQPDNRARGYAIALQKVEIKNGQITIQDDNGPAIAIAITQLTGTADSVAAPLHLAADLAIGGVPFHLEGVLGPIERFSGIGKGPWPIDMVARSTSATGSVTGEIDQPRVGRGYDFVVNLKIPALEALVPDKFFGGHALPALHDLVVSARIVDQNSPIPAIDDLSVKAGPSDLSSLRAGLALSALDIELPSLDQPLSLKATGTIDDQPLALTAQTGPPQAVLNPKLLPDSMPPQGSFPLAISAQAGAARVSVTGAIATPQTLSGTAVAVNATIPDVSKLGSLAGRRLPDWKNVFVQGTIVDPGGLGLHNAAGIDGLAVTMDDASFGGNASIYFGPHPRLQLALKFFRVNIDALQGAMPKAPVMAATRTELGSPKLLPNLTLPLNLMKPASANILISADTVVWNGATYTALEGHATLANGILTINPLSGELPGGSVDASASLDSTTQPATETAKLDAPALALSPFLRAFGLPDSAQGTVDVQLLANSSGNSFGAMVSNLNGELGLAMVNGTVDGSVMDSLFGAVLGAVGLPEHVVGARGPVAVRCMALRVDATEGIGTIRALTLDSSRLLLQGGGSVDFGNETLGIILRPSLQVAGTEIGVPVEVGGTFLQPTTSVAPFGALKAAAKTAMGLPVDVAQQVFGENSIIGQAATKLGLGSGGDVCPAALSLGRLGQAGPAAPPMPRSPATNGIAAPILNAPRNLLNSLFGK